MSIYCTLSHWVEASLLSQNKFNSNTPLNLKPTTYNRLSSPLKHTSLSYCPAEPDEASLSENTFNSNPPPKPTTYFRQFLNTLLYPTVLLSLSKHLWVKISLILTHKQPTTDFRLPSTIFIALYRKNNFRFTFLLSFTLIAWISHTIVWFFNKTISLC